MVSVARPLPRESHDRKRDLAPTEFIGVDGEGVTRPDGKHDYVLLSVGESSLFHDDGSRLHTLEIFEFLWSSFLKNPKATYVGFYLGYDFTHWVRDLPESRARLLFTNEGIAKRARSKSGGNTRPFPVEHRGWCFDFLGFKRFRLWECPNHTYEKGHKCPTSLRLYICDSGAFFQTSFLNVVEPSEKKWPNGAVLSDVEYSKLREGKEERGFTLDYGQPIPSQLVEYNILENDVLGRVLREYDKGLKNIGVRLRKDQWFGPGQAAQTWLNKQRAPTREDFEKVTDVAIRATFRASYYGGWFEIFAHGHIPGISWGYDINSAYPDIQSTLPCLLHGKWFSGKGSIEFRGGYCVVYATLTGSNRYIGAMPHRLRSGNIIRPKCTRGFYWLDEIEAGINAGIIDDVQIHNWLSYDPCNCQPPFRELRNLYRERLRSGKNSVGGKARRLVYNSTYGKTAQSIGTAKFANPFYASLITSRCRTAIVNAIATHPGGANDVLMVATDGLVFRNRHPYLHISPDELGAWEETKHSNLTLFMPGIYWDDDVRDMQKAGKSSVLKSRGIPAASLIAKRAAIDESFNNLYSGEGWPTFTIPIAFSIISPKQALQRNFWGWCGLVSTDAPRIIDSDPRSKRNSAAPYIDDNGLLRCDVYNLPEDEIESIEYRKVFGDIEQVEIRKEMEALLTQDGDIMEQFIHAVRGE